MKAFTSVLLLAVLVGGLQAQDLEIAKGKRVTLRIPAAAFKTVKRGAGYTELFAPVERDGEALKVDGSESWMSVGLAPATSARIADAKFDKKKGLIHLKLDRKVGDDVDVSFPRADSAFIVSRIFARPSDSAIVHEASLAAVGARVFQGPMGAVTSESRVRLLELTNRLKPADSIRVVRLQERPYLMMPRQSSDVVYNTNQTSEAERYAGVLNEVAFPVIRLVGAADSSDATGYGFAVVAVAKSKAFAERFSFASGEDLTVYVPAQIARRFARAELTSQDVIDSSIVLAKGNRIKVDLTR